MDTLIDKLAQKLTTQDMARNGVTTPTKENRKLKEQIEHYESMLEELKQISVKNVDSAERVSKIAREGYANLQRAFEDLKGDPETTQQYFDDLFDRVDDSLHKENVKVYRNVQAVINDGLKEQTEKLLEEQKREIQKNARFSKVMGIVILSAVVADIALQVIRMLGLI